MQQSQTLNTKVCNGEIRVVYWHDAKPGDQGATTQNPNSSMVCNQGFLKAEIEG